MFCRFDKKYSPGGAAQNTMRVLQWILQEPSTVMIGAIGNDLQGQQLKEFVEEAGVVTRSVCLKT